MKQHLIKPGFELIFALSIITIIGLPPLVFAQNNRRVEININNGDTVVNGKNIKELSAADREQALKDIQGMGKAIKFEKADHQRFLFKKHAPGDTTRGTIIFEDGPGDILMDRGFAFKGDSMRHFKFRFRGPNGNDTSMAFNFRGNPDEFRFEPRDFGFRERDFDMPMRMREFGMMRRNSQNFDYSNTGSDGMTTHINFRVSDASAEKTKEITGSEKTSLELKDLNLVPEFTSGKTMLMFSLPARGSAEVKFMDHEGKVIWSDKALNGSFSKKFELGLNGIYLLQVKQAGKVALKRIVREQ